MSLLLKKDRSVNLTPDEWKAVRELLTVAADYLRDLTKPLGVGPMSGDLSARLRRHADHADELRGKLNHV